MKRVLLALLGLILLVILAYFCFQNKADTIREDLTSSTKIALSNHNITGVTATLVGQDIKMTDIMRLTGEVASLEVKAEAETITRAIEGISDVDNKLTVIQQAAPAIPFVNKVDTTNVAQTTTNTELNNTVAKSDPYTLNITKDKANSIILEGYVNSSEKKSELLNYAQKLFGSKNVTDKVKVSLGAPEDWEHISMFALDRLKDVDYGDMKLRNQSYEFTGHLPSPSTKANFLDGIREVMSDPENKYSLYRGDYIITAPVEEPTDIINKKHTDVKACQTQLNEILKDHKILFDYNNATIRNDSYSLLNKVLKNMKSCHVSLLEIAGHTDNQGTSTYNKKLSNLRAASVKKYFVKKGFNEKKLRAIGYGESKPIVSNITKKGRAKNRRIEFIVKGVEK